MNNVYNLKQEDFNKKNQSLTDLKVDNERDHRKNQILNGFVLIIGVVGFLATFSLPRDLVYNRSTLENSFSNSTIASNSLPQVKSQKNAISLNVDEHFQIDGFYEAGEMLTFKLESFQTNNDVSYTIHFGNGDQKIIEGQMTHYQYSDSGNYQVKVLAKYKGEEKEIYKEKLFIDEAIIINSEAFIEFN